MQRRANVIKGKQDKQRQANIRLKDLWLSHTQAFQDGFHIIQFYVCYEGKSGEKENCLQISDFVANRSGDYREMTKSDISIIVTDEKVIFV